MRFIIFLTCFTSLSIIVSKAQAVSQIKKELESTPDPIGYIKFKLRKNYKIDTVAIVSTNSFVGFADSLAYYGKPGKVYGPFKGKSGNYLLKILVKAPNTFYHVSHILLDTTVFRPRFADSLATGIINKIKSGTSTFESMARTYSSDNHSAFIGGDLGWFTRGVMLPQLDNAIALHKKGEVFKVWTEAGLHIITVKDNPKKDNGFVLMLRVML